MWKMYIYNATNNNKNTAIKKGYKKAQRKKPRLSIGRGIKVSTTLNRKRTKRRRLKRENIKFLKQLGFQVKKK